jgi:hypothetical protein
MQRPLAAIRARPFPHASIDILITPQGHARMAPSLSRMPLLVLVAGVLTLAMCGCATRATTNVDRRMILPPGAPMLEVEDNQRLLAPAIIDAPSPAYPEIAAAAVPATVVVCIELVVGAEGEVASVRQFAPEPDCQPPVSAASALFFPPVAAAVQRWSFFGAAICTVAVEEAECDGEDAVVQAVPVTLAYRFVFTRDKDGARVRTHAGR